MNSSSRSSSSRPNSSVTKSAPQQRKRSASNGTKAKPVAQKKSSAVKPAAGTKQLPKRNSAAKSKMISAKRREEEFEDSDEQVDPVDDDLGKNTTLTIFAKGAFTGQLRKSAHTHAKKLLHEIQKQKTQGSSDDEDEDEQDESSSDEDSVISLKVPEEPKMPPLYGEEQRKYRSKIVKSVFPEERNGKFSKAQFEATMKRSRPAESGYARLSSPPLKKRALPQ